MRWHTTHPPGAIASRVLDIGAGTGRDAAALARRGHSVTAVEPTMLTAVWMHLDATQQREAVRTLRALAAPGGQVWMTLRHGPVPEGRRMFGVTANEVSLLAAEFGLRAMHRTEAPDMLDRPDVHWTFLVLEATPGSR